MTKILILGATGGTGAAITNELINRKIPVIVFGRSLTKLQQRWSKAKAATGDVFDSQSIINAGKDADVIIQCAAIPYSQTANKQIPLAKSVLSAAQKLKIPVIFIDGIYAYGQSIGRPIKESDPYKPISNKGRVKKELVNLLRDPQYADIKPTLIHLPDYFGPTARNSSYLGATMIGIAQKKMTFYIGPKNVKREFVYLPDAAKMIVNIVLDPSSYGQNWNIPGQIITGKRLIDYANKIVNNTKPVLTMTRLLINIVGLFDANVKEIAEMYYLTTNPVFLNSKKYQKHFGQIVKTPFNKSIPATIKQIAEK